MSHKPTTDEQSQRDTTVVTTSRPDLSRRTLLKTGTVAGGTLALSGFARTGGSQPDDEPPKEHNPEPAKGVDRIRVPQLNLDTLEAEVEGETLQAVSYEDWRSNSTTYVGKVSGIRGPDVFVGISRLDDDAEQDPELVVYLCNGEVGAVPTIRIYQTGDYDPTGVTLTDKNVPSANEHIEVKLASVGDTFLGSLTLAEGEPHPLVGHEATGDAGLYKAETADEDLVVHWVVFPDGRQRGGLDGKGNDVFVGGTVNKYCFFGYCVYY